MDNLLDKTTQLWVRLTGKRFDPKEESWLIGPIGGPTVIADQFIDDLLRAEDLERSENQAGYGLLDRFSDLELNEEESQKLAPEIVHFYENTYDYHIEFWSQWKGAFKPIGWLLSKLFSRRLQQLNLPLNSLDAAKGLESNVIKLKKGDEVKWTMWYRRFKQTQKVIYSGIYLPSFIPNLKEPVIKVIFPLPHGNATVFMQRDVQGDGSLLLSSNGKKLGDKGFYFTLVDAKGRYWVKYVRLMHEWIRLYVDEDKFVRADHTFQFAGIKFLKLHYKMMLKEIKRPPQ